MKRLPEINVLPVYSVHLKVLDKNVKYSPFNVEQEKALITALEDNNTDDIIRNYEQILKGCVKDEIDWETLSVVDYITLIINIRSKSKGEAIELTKKECDNCKKSFDFSVDISEAIIYENEDKTTKTIKITDQLTLEIRPLSYEFLYGLGEMKTEIDIITHTVAHCISKVIYGKEIYKATPKDLKERMLKNFGRNHLEKIMKESKELITIKMKVFNKCPHCGYEETIIMDEFLKSLK